MIYEIHKNEHALIKIENYNNSKKIFFYTNYQEISSIVNAYKKIFMYKLVNVPILFFPKETVTIENNTFVKSEFKHIITKEEWEKDMSELMNIFFDVTHPLFNKLFKFVTCDNCLSLFKTVNIDDFNKFPHLYLNKEKIELPEFNSFMESTEHKITYKINEMDFLVFIIRIAYKNQVGVFLHHSASKKGNGLMIENPTTSNSIVLVENFMFKLFAIGDLYKLLNEKEYEDNQKNLLFLILYFLYYCSRFADEKFSFKCGDIIVTNHS